MAGGTGGPELPGTPRGVGDAHLTTPSPGANYPTYARYPVPAQQNSSPTHLGPRTPAQSLWVPRISEARGPSLFPEGLLHPSCLHQGSGPLCLDCVPGWGLAASWAGAGEKVRPAGWGQRQAWPQTLQRGASDLPV